MQTNYKDHQYISKPYANSISIQLDSLEPINKFRVSLAFQNAQFVQSYVGLLVYGNMVNGYLGSIGSNTLGLAGANVFVNDSLVPADGRIFQFPTKVRLEGTYNITFSYLDGTQPVDGNIIGTVVILVEYYN
jgi:hypothetical protein